ncbi:uncharacterized protein LOC118436467 [Folsomia candida]|nr:uncharacterized protein LOC118436467 [Folsomia candida]
MYKFLTEDDGGGDNSVVVKRADGGGGGGGDGGGDNSTKTATREIDGHASNNNSSKLLLLFDENEDNVKSALDEIGHKLMREQIDQYVDLVVAQLTGMFDPGAASPQTPKDRYPVLKILDRIRLIMQKTCSPVKAEFFELALNSFLKVQLESFHVKEPYISHAVFVRIEYALKNCLAAAKAHVFGQDTNSTSTCDAGGRNDKTSKMLDVHGDGKEIVKLPETPPYAVGVLDSGAIREPLIETVWKMLINAHSYCYPYFKAYFNDHHALTVTLLPLFNNAIQDLWLKEGGYDVDHHRLYGGMLGDVKRVLEDVDNCVSASRQISQYPWYMSRPMRDSGNKWKRKRRRRRDAVDTGLTTRSKYFAPSPVWINDGHTLCLFDPDDPVAFLGKPICT